MLIVNEETWGLGTFSCSYLVIYKIRLLNLDFVTRNWTTFCMLLFLAHFGNNACTINFPTHISVSDDEPEILVPYCEI